MHFLVNCSNDVISAVPRKVGGGAGNFNSVWVQRDRLF